MTFRVSKYTYNSWKTAAHDKNIIFIFKNNSYFNVFGVLMLTASIINFILGINYVRQLVKDNRVVQEKVNIINLIKIKLFQFENRKTQQMAFDYMIFSQSRKESEKNVDQLSLV